MFMLFPILFLLLFELLSMLVGLFGSVSIMVMWGIANLTDIGSIPMPTCFFEFCVFVVVKGA